MKILVGCDLFMDLKLYKLPDNELHKLGKEFPDVDIIPVNVENHPLYNEDIEIYWGNRINPEIINACKKLKWIHFGSLGVNNARCDLIEDRGIKITNSKGTVERSVALSAFSYFLALARGLKVGSDLSHAGNFSRHSFDYYYESMMDMEQFRVLIVGYGEIGRILAKFIKSIGGDIDVVVRSPENRKDKLIDRHYSLDGLVDAVKDADAVFNLLPITESTQCVFNENIFSNMKKKPFFINVGRGETVDESAMLEALNSGQISGAGLDVFQAEPLSEDSPLHRANNVIITPHIAAISPGYWHKEVSLFKNNLSRYTNNQDLINLVDMSKGY